MTEPNLFTHVEAVCSECEHIDIVEWSLLNQIAFVNVPTVVCSNCGHKGKPFERVKE